uniref:Uncharacterized protein n=1 Tax=Avena sativa TaxID=4498 RepID=A0ACD5XNS3_AVESA
MQAAPSGSACHLVAIDGAGCRWSAFRSASESVSRLRLNSRLFWTVTINTRPTSSVLTISPILTLASNFQHLIIYIFIFLPSPFSHRPSPINPALCSRIMAHGKRSRQQADATTSVSLLDLDSGDMARILLLFSGHHHYNHGVTTGPSSPERVFECKTCNRQFPSFQALGGHRASHKKPRLADGAEPPKPKVHGCSICGLQFAVGQALGGHMRRHRAVAVAGEGLDLGLGLGLKDFGDKKTIAPAKLVLDLNVPAALEEEPSADCSNRQLGLAVDFPMVVDFRR